jgi:hypothetical protein
VISLREFLDTPDALSVEDRRVVIDEALVLIEQLYVHLPLKRAMHAVDPVQRLKLLQRRVEGLSEREFHDEMIAIFVGLRDLHTNYLLPIAFDGKIAFLPFRLEEFYEGGAPSYLVTSVTAGFSDEHFKPGVQVRYWNGVPIDRAVDVGAARQAGSNPDARHARGLSTLTLRPLGMASPPDEEWVVVGFDAGGERREIRLEWQVFEPEPSPIAVDPKAADDALARTLGFDAITEAVRRASKSLFAPDAMETERQAARAATGVGADPAPAPAPDPGTVSTLPDIFQFRAVTTVHGEFGYIRIRTFMGRDVEGFIRELVRIVGLLPGNGLILDVRGNGGGVIMNGERMLQLFTPRRIEPERLHFINTPLTLRLCQRVDGLEPWVESIEQAVETGAAFSDGFPVLPGHAEDCNSVGQVYHGPVVLVTDALCYSTTDISAAGFQDHEIGPILGTAGNTGAGGANVWTLELISQALSDGGSPPRTLPGETSFRVALRRTTRAGVRSGDPVEDLGVVPDAIHHLTRRDLLEGNPDLIERAGEMLASLRVRSLSATLAAAPGGALSVKVSTAGISRLDVVLDGRPRVTQDEVDGETVVELPSEWGAWRALELRGFEGGELVAMRRLAPTAQV